MTTEYIRKKSIGGIVSGEIFPRASVLKRATGGGVRRFRRRKHHAPLGGDLPQIGVDQRAKRNTDVLRNLLGRRFDFFIGLNEDGSFSIHILNNIPWYKVRQGVLSLKIVLNSCFNKIVLRNDSRKDFPIYGYASRKGLPFIYLDSAATSLKPRRVIDAVARYYSEYSANVHRGVYSLAEQATQEFEAARDSVARFIGSPRREEVIFTKGATEVLNLIAASYARHFLREGDGILLTEMEHHANLIPWQEVAKEKKLKLYFIPFDPATGELVWDVENFPKFLRERNIKIVSLTHVSNVFGTINPVKEIAARAHKAGAIVVVDGAQAVPHVPVNIAELGADFYVFSGHKMLGPTGIGVLWGRYELLASMPPYQTGGEMIEDVHWEYSTFQPPPLKFEAGTPPIASAIGLGEAVKYLEEVGMEKIRAHEKELLTHTLKKLEEVPGISILGPRDIEKRSGVIAFTVEGVHPHDIASMLDEKGVMIRSGDHCARPLHKKLKIPASNRISVYLYNDKEDIDRVVEGLKGVITIFQN